MCEYFLWIKVTKYREKICKTISSSISSAEERRIRKKLYRIRIRGTQNVTNPSDPKHFSKLVHFRPYPDPSIEERPDPDPNKYPLKSLFIIRRNVSLHQINNSNIRTVSAYGT
jgi:hypothetical protein